MNLKNFPVFNWSGGKLSRAFFECKLLDGYQKFYVKKFIDYFPRYGYLF